MDFGLADRSAAIDFDKPREFVAGRCGFVQVSNREDLMAKVEWGIKRFCEREGCDARFYDMLQDPIKCPICGTVVKVEQPESTETEFENVSKDTAKPKDTSDDHIEGNDILEDDDVDVDIDDDMLEDGDEDTVPLEDIANVSTDDES